MLKKRGQVSTFVIIGVLVLFVFVFIFMLRDSVREKFRGTVDREGYLISQMSQIKKSINEFDRPQTIKAMSKYFKIKENKLEIAMETYFNLMIKNNLSNITGWLTFWEDLEEAMNLRKITDRQKMELLNLSISIVAPSYEEFINFAINT